MTIPTERPEQIRIAREHLGGLWAYPGGGGAIAAFLVIGKWGERQMRSVRIRQLRQQFRMLRTEHA